MNIEQRFLQKAIEDKNYVNFSYNKENITKVKAIKLILKDGDYFLHTVGKVFESKNIKKLQILKEQF